MPSMVHTKSVKRYTTSDGREFDDKHEALAHQAGFNFVSFLNVVVPEETGYRILEAIKADIDGFRDVIGPLLRRRRIKLQPQVPGIDLNEVDPVDPGELTYEPMEGEAALAPKRRGRPPGSKNRPKANGEEMRAES